MIIEIKSVLKKYLNDYQTLKTKTMWQRKIINKKTGYDTSNVLNQLN